MAKMYKLNFMGDVMLGRLVDQLFLTHVDEPSEQQIVQRMTHSKPHLKHYEPSSPWGTALPVLKSGDLNLINLETSATTHPEKWPDKVFNYRMHPSNLSPILKAGQIDYIGLANNHTLDFSLPGLLETVETARSAGVAFAGAGTNVEEAQRPAQLSLDGHSIHIYALSDHPDDWSTTAQFHHLGGYNANTRSRLHKLLTSQYTISPPPALKVVSIHWGPNYSWTPAPHITALAHFLIDECDVDIIHGHSSHHVQGVEVYNGKLIIYGCGDFVDDYAVVSGDWRNDLSAVWQVHLRSPSPSPSLLTKKPSTKEELQVGREKLQLARLEIFPTRIQNFSAHLLSPGEDDHDLVCRRVTQLSRGFDTTVRAERGGDGQLIIDL